MNTHVDMLVVRIQCADSLGHLLRGVRRSRVIAARHGLPWPLVRDAAYGRVRQPRGRKVAA